MEFTDAFVMTAYGVGEIRHWRLPPDGVTVRVEACGLCQRDAGIWSGNIHRPLPEVLGHEVVGTVVDSGPNTPWPVGTRVAGMGNHGLARYMRVPVWQVAPVPGIGTHLALVEPLACAINACEQDPSPVSSAALVTGLGLLGQLIAAVLIARGRRVIATDRDTERLALAAASGAVVCEPDSPELAQATKQVGVAYECSASESMLWTLTTTLPVGAALLLVAHHRTSHRSAQLLDQWHVRGINVRNVVPRTSPDMGTCVRTAAKLPIDLTRYPIRTGGLGDAPQLLDGWPTGRLMRHVVLIDEMD